MPKSIPLVGLLTDFGSRDHYVGTMKAVMAGRVPSLRIIDISHEVAPGNVPEAAYLLWASYSDFPAGAVLTVVVDPGVGTSRRILIARSDSHTFVAPDNGILDLVLWEEGIRDVIVFDTDAPDSQLFLPRNISATFHGRDIFAPLAAYLAQGKSVNRLGKKRGVPAIHSPFLTSAGSKIIPVILHIDHFGNIVTNLRLGGKGRGQIVGLSVGGRTVTKWVRTFAEASSKSASLLIGSSGLVEIVCRGTSAATCLKARMSTVLRLLVN